MDIDFIVCLRGKNPEYISRPLNPYGLSRMGKRHSIEPVFIIDIPIPGNLSHGSKIRDQTTAVRKGGEGLMLVMLFHWNDISGSRDDTVFLVTPGSGRMVEIGNVDEGSADNEVLLHIAYKSFHGSFCKWMGDLAELRSESYQGLKCFVLLVPYRSLVSKSFHDNSKRNINSYSKPI